MDWDGDGDGDGDGDWILKGHQRPVLMNLALVRPPRRSVFRAKTALEKKREKVMLRSRFLAPKTEAKVDQNR
jgi:hypothetical protein